MLTFILIFLIIFFIGTHIGFYLILNKAGEQGWKAFVPFLGPLTRFKVVGRPSYWIFYFFIPIVNLFCWYYTIFDLLKSFGRTRFIDSVYGALFPFIYLPYLGNSKDEKYLGKASELPKIDKSTAREWTDAILFAVIAATLIRWSVMEAYTIPTPSMEKSLLVGDFLFVSKFHYGTRTPATPLQIPLTHQEIPGLGLKSYSNLIQLPQYRLPGLTTVKNNDVVVFNVPANVPGGDGRDEFNRDRPVDLKTNYIKRCMGIAGDVLEVKDRMVYINGKLADQPELSQYQYQVNVTSTLRDRVLDKFNIYDVSGPYEIENGYAYGMFLTDEQVEALKKETFVNSIEMVGVGEQSDVEGNIYPNGKPWNKDWYGPVTIPAKGQTIEINAENLKMYGQVIKYYEYNDNVIMDDNTLSINGESITSYTFKQNYYFMMGDNRHNSLDSRYWGFVPEDHIVGKAYFIWLSLDPNKGLFSGKIRWSRFLNLIH